MITTNTTRDQLRGMLVDDCHRNGLPFQSMSVPNGTVPRADIIVDTLDDLRRWAVQYGQTASAVSTPRVSYWRIFFFLAGCSVLVMTPHEAVTS